VVVAGPSTIRPRSPPGILSAWEHPMSRFAAPVGFTLAAIWVAVLFVLVGH
jgi:hypothetical protein